jgi:integration host factor subunit alpha
MTKTLTRAHLANTIYDTCNVPLSTAAQLVDMMIDAMIETLASEEALKLSGFGTFRKNRKRQRMGRNPKNGVAAVITPRTVISFTTSGLLKKAVNDALNQKA